METHAIIGDIQAPYHSRKALDIALQILHDVKPTSLTLNGDVVDCRKLALRYPSDDGAAPGLISELKSELERSAEVVRKLVKAAGTKRLHWTDGNHEYRIWRAMAMAPQTMQLMGIQAVRDALNTIALLKIEDLKFKYAGPYPNGFWLRGSAPVEENFWIEHGYIVRKKSAYTCSALMEERHANVICGHVERLAEIHRKIAGPNGDRHLIGIEGGTLSGIGETGIGEGIYTGIPHSVPAFMNHAQGFAILHYDSGQWWSELVHIKNGRAIFRGKLYKS